MKYVGSKNRISKQLAPIIQSYIDDNDIKAYWEPFVGGANMIDKIKCERRVASDIHPYLIALLKQAQIDVSCFPETISKEEYKAVRSNPSEYPDWYVGLVGFCASYNSKWFGGYANNVKTKTGIVRNYTDEAIRNLVKQAPQLKGIIFYQWDYRDITGIKNVVIYCDPPYQYTTKYSTGDFDYEEFYEWMRKMSKDNIVLVSEYNMPDDFECIWEQELTCTLDKNKRSKRVERLFKWKG